MKVARDYMEKVFLAARADNPSPVSETGLGFIPGKGAEKPAKSPCNRNGISARTEQRTRRSIDCVFASLQICVLRPG